MPDHPIPPVPSLQLFAAHGAELIAHARTVARRILGPVLGLDAADEAANDGLLKVARGLRQSEFHEFSQLKGWVGVVVRRRCVDHLRKRRFSVGETAEAIAASRPDTEVVVMHRQLLKRLRIRLAQIPKRGPRLVEILNLLDEGLSQVEIAVLIGRSPAAVCVDIRHIRELTESLLAG